MKYQCVLRNDYNATPTSHPPHDIGASCAWLLHEDPPNTPPQPHTHKPPNPGHKYTPRGKKMLRGVYFFGPIGMKGGEEGSARVGSGETGGEGGAVGGAVAMLSVLFASWKRDIYFKLPPF